MYRKQILCAVLALVIVMGLAGGVGAAQVDCDTTYCFTQEDFSEAEGLTGICITGLPDPKTGTVLLGSRVLRSGDILTAQQLSQLTFIPVRSEEDQQAIVTFLPIYENRVERSTSMTISIRGKKDQAPVAEDQAMETYKNLPNGAVLKASDPEGQALTYTVTRQPKRGTVEIGDDGTFTYTPRKNKVGVDSFLYTVTDPAGNVSREATVTIRILKPADGTQYADTISLDSRFPAEWLKSTGIFTGENIGGHLCFQENRPVSRGEFLTMALQVLGIPVDEKVTTSVYTDSIPLWLQPYLAAALRSGMTAGLPVQDNGAFGADQPISTAEAAVMLQNAMDLSVSVGAVENVPEDVPQWAAAAVAAMGENGVYFPISQQLTRGQAAQLLYQISKLVESAPGLQMYQ